MSDAAVILVMRDYERDALHKTLADCGPGVEPRVALHVIDAQGHDIKPRLPAGVSTHVGLSDLLAVAYEEGRYAEHGTTCEGMDCTDDRPHDREPVDKMGAIAAGLHRAGVLR